MKKYVLAAAVLSAPLLLTGCGKKQTLTCTQSLMGMMDAEIKLEYKDGKASGGKATMTIDYGTLGATEEELKEVKSQSLCDEMGKSSDDDDLSKAYDKCTEKWDGNKVTMTIKLNNKYGDKDDYKTIDKAKEVMEKEGYTCEIK